MSDASHGCESKFELAEGEMVRVLVIKVPVGNRGDVWIVQSIDGDMATQGNYGGTALDAVDDLGHMFDIRDQNITEYERQGLNVSPLPRTPAVYVEAWENGADLGFQQLGFKRLAHVRSVDKDPMYG